jgi:aconitate hydratase
VGNSGNFSPAIEKELREAATAVASVSSGNRNFPGRIHPRVAANYLMSPALVVAYALAGTVRGNIATQTIGNIDGVAIRLNDLWPSRDAVDRAMAQVSSEDFRQTDDQLQDGGPLWDALADVPATDPWKIASDFICRPDLSLYASAIDPTAQALSRARPLLILGNDVTTDHISPVGRIVADSPAGRFLSSRGRSSTDLGSYGAWRGNQDVMIRGTFFNSRLANEIVPEREGAWTRMSADGEALELYAAAEKHRAKNTPLMIIAGRNYGMGSARDWAAKGTRLLGVRAVLAMSFERIHRTNLVLLGVLPLQFLEGHDEKSKQITVDDRISINASHAALCEARRVPLVIERDGMPAREINVRVRLDTEYERNCYREGGVLGSLLPR